MRYVTWIVSWFRLSRRPLPLAIALTLGMIPAVAKADENTGEPAPVLRVARPYPELKVPPKSNSTQPPAGVTSNPAETSSRRQSTVPQTVSSPSVHLQTTNDGWIARDMIGKRTPLSDPTVASPQSRSQQLSTAPKPTTVPNAAAAPPRQSTTTEHPDSSQLETARSDSKGSPQAANVFPMPAAPMQIGSGQPNRNSLTNSGPSTTTSSRRETRGNTPPSLSPDAGFPDSTGKETEPGVSTTEPDSVPAQGEVSHSRTWQAADSGPIISTSPSSLAAPKLSSAIVGQSETATSPSASKTDQIVEVTPHVHRQQTNNGWQSVDNSDHASTDEDGTHTDELLHALDETVVDSEKTIQKLDSIDSDEQPAELQRMLDELQRMKPVARMKRIDQPEQAPNINSAPASDRAADTKIDLNKEIDQSIEVAPQAVTPTEPARPNEIRPQGPLARPELAPSNRTPASGTGQAFKSEQFLPATRDRNDDQVVDAEIRDSELPMNDGRAEENLDASVELDGALPPMNGARELDIPIRRPSIGSPQSSSRETGRLETRSSGSPASEYSSRESTRSNGDTNHSARNLQEQIERFERGEASSQQPASTEMHEAHLDAAADPTDSELRPKTAQSIPARKAPVISAAAQRLDQPIRQTLAYYHQRPEKAAQRTPWGMLHAILPFNLDANVDANRRYNAIAYLAGNNPNRNLRMLSVTRGGRLVARSGVGLQGHQAQMLAIFAQVGVPADYPLYVSGKKFIMNDLVKTEMLACKAKEELTFTLIGLSHYLPTDTKWRSADGQVWDFEKLLAEEMSQPVVGAACGGTHRLMGLSYALKQRKLEGLPVTGQWARAETYLKDFEAYAWQLQNRDGSFSTDWFEGRADNGDLDRKVQTTGHILEWLLFVTEDDRLNDERVTRSVSFLTESLLNERGREWQVGPKGHALRALSVYHQRVFNSDRPWQLGTGQATRQSTQSSSRR